MLCLSLSPASFACWGFLFDFVAMCIDTSDYVYMSHQGNVWEREYQDPKLVTKHAEPQGDTLRFLKFLKKECKFDVMGRTILDVGCGAGRNANYLADLGNVVIGIEISATALAIARKRAMELGVVVDYRLGDIGERYDITDKTVDIVLDVTSSN